jgi:predicted PurR-regulated permease PerM
MLFVVAFLIVVITVGPLWNQVVDFVHQIPQYWEDISNSDLFQQFISSGAQEDVKKWLADAAQEIPSAASTLLGIAGGVFGSVLSLVTLTFLSLFLLMERPNISAWLFGFAPPATEARWSPVLEDSIKAVSSSLIGNVAISIVAAVVAGFSAYIFGLPFPLVLAVITGLLDLIPQVGATIAAVILTLVALTVSTEAAIAMVIIQLIYQQVENYIVYPIVYRQAVQLTGFTTIVSVLIAGSLLGVVGAILAVPFAAVIKTVLAEAGRPRRARMEELRLAEDREKVAV